MSQDSPQDSQSSKDTPSGRDRERIKVGEDWHLDKKVPIAFIFAILCQTVALVWFFASLSNGLDSNTKDIVRQDARIDALEQSVQGQAVMLARIDENLKAIRDIIESTSGGR